MIVGICGTFASGKDLAADLLKDRHGFVHINTSDLVRQIAMASKGSIERPVLFEVANSLRREKGAGILVKMSLDIAGESQNTVISGIRSIGEVEDLKKAGGIMIFVDAPTKIRYERILNRQRSGEHQLTLEDFIESEHQESIKADPTNKSIQNIKVAGEMSDVKLQNDGTIEDFHAKIVQVLGL